MKAGSNINSWENNIVPTTNEVTAERAAPGLATTLSQVPTYGTDQPSLMDRAQTTFTGTSPFKYTTGVTPDNRIGYVDKDGTQAYTGELALYDEAGNKTGLNTEAINSANTLGSNAFGTTDQTGTGLASMLSGAWNTIGGAKGFSDLASGLGALGSLYSGYQANKRADSEMDALNAERARLKQKDIDFSKGLAASGLGAYSAGL